MTHSEQYPYWLYDDDGKLNDELVPQYIAQRDALIQRIETAFKNVPYPGDASLTIEDNGYNGFFGNIPQTLQDFRGKHWKELSTEFVLKRPSSLSVFTRRAYHFYLPAYMIGVLLEPYSGSVVPTELLLDFAKGETQLVAVQLNEFSAEQCAVILEYLKFYDSFSDDFVRSSYSDILDKAIQKLTTNS